MRDTKKYSTLPARSSHPRCDWMLKWSKQRNLKLRIQMVCPIHLSPCTSVRHHRIVTIHRSNRGPLLPDGKSTFRCEKMNLEFILRFGKSNSNLFVSRPLETLLSEENLIVEVWDFDPAETVGEKMSKIMDVKGVKGLGKLMKEIALTASTGKHDNELIGRCTIALKVSSVGYWKMQSLNKNIWRPLDGAGDWFCDVVQFG